MSHPQMHGNWVKIRVFEQALLRKLSAAIEGQHPGKRGREDDGDAKPADKKLAAATIAVDEDAATNAEAELAVFRGSEVLHKLHHQLRLPNRTQLWAFYIYHLVTTSTALPTDYREAPAAAVAALLLACKVREEKMEAGTDDRALWLTHGLWGWFGWADPGHFRAVEAADRGV
jgi:hypothetical protein